MLNRYEMNFKPQKKSYKGTLTLSVKCYYCKRSRRIVFKGAWPEKMRFGEVEA